MNTLDFIILGITVLFGVWGFKQGFMEALGGILGVVIATILSGKFFLWLADFFGGSNLASVVAFLLIFAITLKVVGFVFWFFGKIFKLIAVLPFVDSFNRVLGVVLGLLQGVLICTVAVYLLNKYPLNGWFVTQLQTSFIADILLTISIIFLPLLPESLRKLRGIL